MPRGRKPAGQRRRRAPWEDSSAEEDDSALGTDSSGGGLDSDSGAVVSGSSAATLQRAEKERVSSKAARTSTERSGLTDSSGPEPKRQRTASAGGPVVIDEAALGRNDQRLETANVEAAASVSSAGDRVDNEELSDAAEIETEPEFDDGYDSQGYGDEQDRKFLLSLTAVERETILAERFERRQREYEAWRFRKALRERRRAAIEAKRRRKTLALTEATPTAEQERAKKKTRKQALDALARVKRRGKASSRKRVEDHQHVSDDDDASTSDWSAGRSASFDEADSVPSDAYTSDDLKDETYDLTRSIPPSYAGAAGARHKLAGERTARKLASPLSFGDLVDPQTGEPTPLVLTRGVVERFHQKPWFARFALGSFVRVPLPVPPAALSGANAVESQQPQQRYVLARVSAILKAPRLYPVPSTQQAHGMHLASTFYVGFRIQAELCGRQRRFTVDQLSRHPPTEIEWMHYEKRHREQHLPLPRREEVEALRAEKAAFMRGEVAPTEEELAQFQTEFERLHPEAVNYARRITQVRAQLAHAQETGDHVQQRTLAAELVRLEELEKRYGQRPRENTSSEQVRDLLLSRRHNSAGGGDIAGVARASGAPGADLPLAASLMLLKRTVEEQRSAELNPFARRVARGTSYFFTPSKPASTTGLTEPSKHSGSGPSNETLPGDANQDTETEEERSRALQTLLPEIERWLWYGPVLEPLRNVQQSSESDDIYAASRAWYERHLVGIQGEHPTPISSASPDRC